MDSFDFESGNEAEQEMPAGVAEVLEAFVEEDDRFEFSKQRDFETQNLLPNEEEWKPVVGDRLETIFDKIISPDISTKKSEVESLLKELSADIDWDALDQDEKFATLSRILENQSEEGKVSGLGLLFLSRYLQSKYRKENVLKDLPEKEALIQEIESEIDLHSQAQEFLLENRSAVLNYLVKRGFSASSQ